MKNVKKAILAAGVAVTLSACGASPSSQITPTNPSNPQSNVLQFAVGTANLAGTKGLNVVVTYRQPQGGFNPGDSAVLVSSPQIHMPGKTPPFTGTTVPYDGTSTAWSGPAPSETGHLITSTAQDVGSKNITTFGQSGGAFGIGIEPFNYYGPYDAPGPSLVNTPFQVAPYPVPLYNPPPPTSKAPPTTLETNAFEPWGGPPAFDLLGNGQSPVGAPNVPSGTAGVSMGLDVFNVTPASGSYKLSVLVASNVGKVTQSKTASMNAGKTLPTIAAAPAFVSDGTGGGSITVAMPAGASEAYVQVTDYGPLTSAAPSSPSGCNGANIGGGTVIYYTIVVHGGGTVSLPDNAGPGGAPSLCDAAANTSAGAPDAFTVQLIAFDYPMYEASYPASLHNPSPTIKGGSGQDDVTISPAGCNEYGAAACPAGTLPLGSQAQLRRAPGHKLVRHH